MLELLTVNLSGKVKRAKLYGRDYLVAPMTMLVEGVLNGSEGPLFYPRQEIATNVDSWNNMPIVKGHPVSNEGKPVSARSPQILETFGMGIVFNADVINEVKLDAEAWYDEKRTMNMDPLVYSKILKNEPFELSTGLYTVNVPVTNAEEAVFNGKSYTAVARNYRPDHLASLGTKKGACSIKDGCGVLVNEDGQTVQNQLSHSTLRDLLRRSLRERYGSSIDIVDVYDNYVVYMMYASGDSYSSSGKYYKVGYQSSSKNGGSATISEAGAVQVIPEMMYKPVKNEESAKPWHSLLPLASLATNEAGEGPDGLTVNHCQCGGQCDSCKETKKKEQNALNPTGNQLVTNQENEDMAALSKDQRTEIIDRLITNEGVEGESPWTEEDRPALNVLSDIKLNAFDKQREKAAGVVENEDEDKEADRIARNAAAAAKAKVLEKKTKQKPTKNESDEEPVANQRPKRKTLDEFMDEAPDEVRSAVNNALKFEKDQKDTLIARIIKNENNQFTKVYLEKRELDELKGIAALATNGEDSHHVQNQSILVPNYAGVPGLTRNLGEDFGTEDSDMAPYGFDSVANDD